MKKQVKVKEIQEILDKIYPKPPVPLKHKDPFTLLIAVLLSARCTDKKVNEVEVSKMKLGEPDASGRRRPIPVVDGEFKIKADLVIKSLGFDPENIPKLFNSEDLAVSKWGTIKIDLKTMQTNIEGVFAAGDIVRGASLVVWAIRDGRDAAEQMDKYISSRRKNNKKEFAA